MNEVINQMVGFYNKSIYYSDTDSLYSHKTYWSSLFDNRFVGITLGVNREDYRISGIIYAWFLAPKIKYCLVIDDFGLISGKRTFKGCSEEDRMIKFDKYISLSEGKTVSGKVSVDWTKTFEGIKLPHRKQDCLDCDNGKKCSDCVEKLEINCFDCEMERVSKSCLNLISQKKTYFTDIKMLKRKTSNECHQMLLYYEGKYEPKQNNTVFESAREILVKEDHKTVVKRRFERI